MSIQENITKGIIKGIYKKIEKSTGGLSSIEILYIKHYDIFFSNATKKDGNRINCTEFINIDGKTAQSIVRALGGKGVHYDIAKVTVNFDDNETIRIILILIKIKDGGREIKFENELILS